MEPEKEKPKAMSRFLIMMSLVAPIALMNGYILSTMWGWFIVPMFEVKGISVLNAYALFLIAGLFSNKTQAQSESDSVFYGKVVFMITRNLFLFFFGYIVVSLIEMGF